MKLEHITLDQLKPSPLNARKKGGKDVGDLTASIRSIGLLQPLLVRSNCEGYDIIAGQRRFRALTALTVDGNADPVPCIIMEDGDDARAIEASLAENIARLPMDEIDQYKAFGALRDEGLDVADIAARFGVTERLVEQRLAIANIIPPILNAYRKEEIDAATLRILTMATPRQQKAWWTLFKSEEDYAPTGMALKNWLFGGSEVPVANALFDVETYDAAIIADLFGEERYFADSEAFWIRQNVAIAERRQAYLNAGWDEVVVLDVGQHFAEWNHRKTPKKKGGKVFVAITRDGEVTFHEGYLTHKEAERVERKAKPEETSPEQAKPERPELTAAMHNYLGLHRHAAVRTELLGHPGLMLRLTVAHIIAGSSLWRVEAEKQRTDKADITESLSQARAAKAFAEERTAVRALLVTEGGEDGDDADAPITGNGAGHRDGSETLEALFLRLTALDDEAVLRVLAFVMAESLAAHTPVVDMLGQKIGTDMRQWWTPDQAFFDLLRDKAAINAMLHEVAGEVTANAHVASTAKVQKKIIADCLSGDGRAKVEGWLPRYMLFPAGGYCGSPVGGNAPLSSDAVADEDCDTDTNEAIAEAV